VTYRTKLLVIYITHAHTYNQQENYLFSKKETRKSFLQIIIWKSLLMYDCSWTLEGADNGMLTRQWNRIIISANDFIWKKLV